MNNDVILAAVINWNGWRDTLTCVESMLRMTGPRFHLVICDNGSADDSHERFCAWARQALGASEQSLSAAGEGGRVTSFAAPAGNTPGVLCAVHVIRLPRNFGYAGAINRCMAWGRESLSPGRYWLLNNDISLDPQALRHLVEAVESAPDIGLCGSVLLDWDHPERVQAVGGMFRPWLAVGSHLKRMPAAAGDTGLYFGADYPVGASMMVTREFVDVVGPMDEGYFLYYEEMDWAERGRAKGFRPAVALRSRIRHKEGASTGSLGGVRKKSMLSEYYGVVNRLRFARKFTPARVPAVWLSLILVVLDRALHGEWRRAALVLRLMLAPGSVPRP